MTQQSSVRFVMEDRYLADTAAYQSSVNAQNTAFQSSMSTQQSNFQLSVASTLASVPGKNYIINGGMDIWQRGTTFAPIANAAYSADRWQVQANVAASSRTVQQFALAGAATGLEYVNYYLRSTINTAGSAVGSRLRHQLEDVSTLSGQTVTLSWWAKTNAADYYQVLITQYFGTGGSTAVTALTDSTSFYTTSWARYSLTFTMPSVAGKTIGANNNAIWIDFFQKDVTGNALDITGVQIEVGSSATVFNRAGGTLAGELAACQRYYYRNTPGSVNPRFGSGMAYSTTSGSFYVPFPAQMRIAPSAIEQTGTAANYGIVNSAGSGVACSGVPTFQSATPFGASLTAASTYTAAGNASFIYSNATTAYLGWSAEF